jgi:chromosome partitioning protein
MRRIALINQKGGVGKTTSSVNLGAALARAGRRVVLIDLDPQANLSMHLDVQLESGQPSTYSVLLGDTPLASAIRDTTTPGLRLVGSCIDLSGAELELANSYGREMVLREALDLWEREHRERHGEAPADYVLLDCPPSLGLLAVNGLVAAGEALLVVQTEFFALQGMTKLVDVVQLLRRRLNPKLEITGILPCLYDNRTKLAREVLGELRTYFPGKVFQRAIAKNVKLAEAPSYGRTIFDYAPGSGAALDYEIVAQEVIAQEARDPELAARHALPREIVVPVPREARDATGRSKRASRVAEEPVSEPASASDGVPENVPAPESVPDPARAREPGSRATGLDERAIGTTAGEACAEDSEANGAAVALLVAEDGETCLPETRDGVVLPPFRALSPAPVHESRFSVPLEPALAGLPIDDLPDLPPDAVLLGRLEARGLDEGAS